MGTAPTRRLPSLDSKLQDETLQGLVELLAVGRQSLMSHLQQLGLGLRDRQALVNAISLAQREDRLMYVPTTEDEKGNLTGDAVAAAFILIFIGLMFRGLTTKVISNGLQAMLFTVIWRYLQDVIERRQQAKKKSAEKET